MSMYYLYIYLVGFALALTMFVIIATRIERFDVTIFDFILMTLVSVVSWIAVTGLILYITIRYGEKKFKKVLFKAKEKGEKMNFEERLEIAKEEGISRGDFLWLSLANLILSFIPVINILTFVFSFVLLYYRVKNQGKVSFKTFFIPLYCVFVDKNQNGEELDPWTFGKNYVLSSVVWFVIFVALGLLIG